MATLRTIARYERRHLYPGGVAEALAVWSRFVHAPERQLNRGLTDYHGPGWDGDDPESARLRLALAVKRLPGKAARELRRQILPLDERYRARFIPVPNVLDQLGDAILPLAAR